MTNNLSSVNKTSHALIVRQAPLSDFDSFLKKYLKDLICPNHGCNHCEWCNKIDKNEYYDLLILDGKKIKRQDIVDLVMRFSRPGLESKNIKVYVIKNIEYASKVILNSLLKFVEEPPVGVYAIFTCKNYNAIIPTIRSRCFSTYLPKDELIADYFLNTKEITSSQKELAKQCFFDIESMQENFDKFIEYLDLINKLNSDDYLLYAAEILDIFKKMEYSDINLFLEICKHVREDISNNIIQLQDNLYLNNPKALIFNEVYNLLTKKE